VHDILAYRADKIVGRAKAVRHDDVLWSGWSQPATWNIVPDKRQFKRETDSLAVNWTALGRNKPISRRVSRIGCYIRGRA
jgi:hypothetical protein